MMISYQLRDILPSQVWMNWIPYLEVALPLNSLPEKVIECFRINTKNSLLPRSFTFKDFSAKRIPARRWIKTCYHLSIPPFTPSPPIDVEMFRISNTHKNISAVFHRCKMQEAFETNKKGNLGTLIKVNYMHTWIYRGTSSLLLVNV